MVMSQMALRRSRGRTAWLVLLAAMAGTAALILWLGRDITYSIDELFWFEDTPNLGIGGALQPHVGHLVLTARLAYAFVFETLGTGYRPFQLLTVVSLVSMVALFFVYASRRVGPVVALAPSLVLLCFGSDPDHLLQGNGFTVLLSIACGLGALLLLERGGPRRDLVACALLCLGVATYSDALAFLVAAAVAVLISGDRKHRIWIFLVPAALYFAWWLWARNSPWSSGEQIALSELLMMPSWGFRSLSAVLGSLSGFDYPFLGSAQPTPVGVTLALASIAALGWRLSRGAVPRTLWPAIAVLLSLWVMQDVVQNAARLPWSPRYLYPVAIAVLMVGAEALRGQSWSRWSLVALYVVAAVGLATNLKLLHDSAIGLREGYSPRLRGELTGIEIAGARASPDYIPNSPAATVTRLDDVFTEFAARGHPPTATYLAAVRRYGRLGYPASELHTLSPHDLGIVRSASIAALKSRH